MALITVRTRARAMEAMRKNKPELLLEGKKPAMAPTAGPAVLKNRIPAEEQKRLDAELIQAADKGKTKEVIALVQEGADVNARDKYGHTVLMRAAANGHAKVARILIDNGADMDAKRGNENALLFARYYGHTWTEAMLMKLGAKKWY